MRTGCGEATGALSDPRNASPAPAPVPIVGLSFKNLSTDGVAKKLTTDLSRVHNSFVIGAQHRLHRQARRCGSFRR
jgi:hypothetical protein